mmetsp:Transcript_7416/g.24321  ORF Transcript_7416/g.24321 Transcript_7416/m.24321 type:complete len:228 (+) Transcript_7416:3007-3690(+)
MFLDVKTTCGEARSGGRDAEGHQQEAEQAPSKHELVHGRAFARQLEDCAADRRIGLLNALSHVEHVARPVVCVAQRVQSVSKNLAVLRVVGEGCPGFAGGAKVLGKGVGLLLVGQLALQDLGRGVQRFARSKAAEVLPLLVDGNDALLRVEHDGRVLAVEHHLIQPFRKPPGRELLGDRPAVHDTFNAAHYRARHARVRTRAPVRWQRNRHCSYAHSQSEVLCSDAG